MKKTSGLSVPSAKIYLVLHHEIFYHGFDIYLADEMVFHTASSLENAVKYIRNCHVDEYSWWEIQEQYIDSPDWPVHVGYYSRKGRKIKSQPYKRCIEIYKKQRA